MPIYAFECASCGHQFDRLQRLSDADPSDCPQCGLAQIRRQLTAPSFRLAGAGWYETDFKKDGDKKRNLAEKSEGATKSDSSGDAGAKPEAKAETGKPETARPETSKPATAKPATAKPEVKPASPPAAGGGS